MAKKKKRTKSPKGAKRSPAQPNRGDSFQEIEGPRPTISACMIVKDEEERLPTALKSIKPWVDEIIVVDTGSTDRTVEIAESFGAKVYHHPWENSFSIHRNQSINYASGDWLLIIDADEELVQDTAPLLHKMARAPKDISGFMFELYNDVSAGGETFLLHARMFRNNIGFRYDGQVHNRPVVPGSMARSGVKLIHYGYNMDARTMSKKHKRRLDMIRKWVENEPDNFQAHSYLAHTYLSDPETVSTAVDEALLALDLMKQQKAADKHYPHAYYPLMNGLAILQRDEEVMRHAQNCLEISPYYPDSVFFIVGVLYKRQKWEEICKEAAHFRNLQRECARNPEKFVFFENMSWDQKNFVYFRWAVAAAQLGRLDECLEVFGYMFTERDAVEACKRAVQTVLTLGRTELALEMINRAGQAEPDWAWIGELRTLTEAKLRENQAEDLKSQGLAALKEGRAPEAADLLREASGFTPESPEVLINLGKAMDEDGKPEQAEELLARGLNGHPGFAWAWKRLADGAFSRGDYVGAEACYQRYLQAVPADEGVASRLSVCWRRMVEAEPTVSMGPPRLVVFLVSGMSPELVRQPAPHFLIGRAWGELTQDREPPPDAPNWATIYTGVGPDVHGLTREPAPGAPLGLADLKVPSIWEVLPPEMKVGLVSIPLGCPPPKLPGWSIAGYPGGLLDRSMVHPPDNLLRVLATGYRSDYILNPFDQQTYTQRVGQDIRQEAFLYQIDRNKLAAAMRMPTVDVLVVGFTALERMQNAFDLAHHATFQAYQQVYGWIESTLSALRPLEYAVLSQRGYAHRDCLPQGGGFYCLSWLKGENNKADPTDIAPEILKHLGGDPSRLGRPRA